MSIKGRLKANGPANAIPAVAPPYSVARRCDFTDVDILRLDYVTDGKSAAAFVPEQFELAEFPKASFQFNSFGFSTAGTYLEAVQSLECSYEGKTFLFPIRLYLNSDTPLITGREWFGIPKLGGTVEFDPLKAASILSAKLERPAGISLATGVFRPDSFAGSAPEASRETWGMRMIPAVSPEEPNVLHELVGYRVSLSGGTVWKGEGTVHLTGASTIDPVHRVPVVEMAECIFFRHVHFLLEPTGRVVDLRANARKGS